MSESRKNILAIVIVALAVFIAGQGRGVVVPPDIVPPAPPPTTSILGPGLNVFIAEETEHRLTLPQGQQDILTSNDWRAKWIARGGKLRQLDATDKHPNDLPIWQAALARPRTSLPWVIVGAYEGPLPADLPAWEALLAKHGGTP